MMTPLVVNPSDTGENPKYIVSIRKARNGYAVEVELETEPVRPMNMKQFSRKMGSITRNMSEHMNGGADEVLMKIRNQAEEEEESEEIQVLGLSVFKTYSEMSAFLSFVYGNEEKEVKKGVGQ